MTATEKNALFWAQGYLSFVRQSAKRKCPSLPS